MKSLTGLLLLFFIAALQAQSVTAWTEENSTLGLGYPVPIPVDTTEAFDGFRTYAGLFAKHQSMAMESPYIQGYVVGQTRYERDIWAYVFSDENDLTQYGVKEGAMLINGSIHAREWQSPEVMTGIMELLDTNSADQSLHQYLLENSSIVILPVNNIDGLLQTQRYPTENYLGTDSNNSSWPRDGRMRRKNMLDVDEDLLTSSDHLLGVDLNRNNSPYWATSLRSSFDEKSILYHGSFSESEPETQARINAAALVDPSQVRVYTDVHSFTQVHFSILTNIQNRNILQADLLRDFTNHHRAFAAAKNYSDVPSGPNSGIGATDEYFAETFQVPSWTLEIEPTGNGAVDYGGFGRNGHDGFILPESQIKRVREELAETFMIAWYGQAGPPSVTRFRIIEKLSGVLVYDAEWDAGENTSRVLYEHVFDNLLPGGEYSLIVSFDKPMRKRDENGEIVHLQGQSGFSLSPIITAKLNEATIDLNMTNPQWLNQKTEDTLSYTFYKDDTFMQDFIVPNDVIIDANSQINWHVDVADMVGQKLDAEPQTAVTWLNGQWQNYENEENILSITGGTDVSYFSPLRDGHLEVFEPLVQETGLYYDPSRNGEGFSYELLADSNKVWIQWFTYDLQGKQRWLSAIGEYSANKIIVNKLTQAQGGIFGAAFDASTILFNDFGRLEIIFNGGQAIEPAIGFHDITRTAQVLFTDLQGKKLRTNLNQLGFVKGAVNRTIATLQAIEEPVGLISGSWYDPARSGEGYIIQILEDGRAVMIWYTYDLEGQLMWLIDSDGVVTAQGDDISLDFNNVQVSDGGIFGEDFDASAVNLTHWGELHFQTRCQGEGVVNYSSVIEGFGSGQYQISKLTQPWVLPYVCNE